MATFIKIATVTVGSGMAANISFTSIPQTYTDLYIKISAKTNASSGTIWDSPFIDFNGTTTNQSTRFLYGNGSTTGSTTDTRQYGSVYGVTTSSSTANTFGNGEVYIPNYTSSNYKSSSGDGVTENNAITSGLAFTANLWSNTAAITSITLTPSSGSTFLQYSIATLYGIKNS